jgi:G3E family GTPase
MTTKIDIISGFLGAGKTTLIKKLLKEALTEEKIVLIENEFGEIGVDGAILKDSGIVIQEMNAGCICCTITGNFTLALKEILKYYAPDRILIEPSGVGKLSDVIKACTPFLIDETVILNMSIVVVDGMKYKMYLKNFAEFYKDQLRNAKTIILSRTQAMDTDAVEFVMQDIRKYNSKANTVTTDWNLLDGKNIINLSEDREAVKLDVEIKNAMKNQRLKASNTSRKKEISQELKRGLESHHADEVFSVWGTETVKVFTGEKLNYILNNLSKLNSNILRAKGIVRSEYDSWLQFDYVPGEITIRNSAPDYTGRICVIGEKLDKEKIEELFGIRGGA